MKIWLYLLPAVIVNKVSFFPFFLNSGLGREVKAEVSNPSKNSVDDCSVTHVADLYKNVAYQKTFDSYFFFRIFKFRLVSLFNLNFYLTFVNLIRINIVKAEPSIEIDTILELLGF